ncbi:hypothetical protein GCM10010393_20500 [Streptomyces gobitricini]|uniref:Uncharacterized protein n=1 Tax=Streptomyces gobitricini TaxID=68211 RepID=A0ABN3LSP6_9ACTN
MLVCRFRVPAFRSAIYAKVRNPEPGDRGGDSCHEVCDRACRPQPAIPRSRKAGAGGGRAAEMARNCQ